MKPTYVPMEVHNNKNLMARINADGSWTVDWDVVQQVAGAKILLSSEIGMALFGSPFDVGVNFSRSAGLIITVAIANLLLAAKGNFQSMSMEHSQKIAEKAASIQTSLNAGIETTSNKENVL